ncbi:MULTISPECIES: RnfH family protein [unclassified Trinickia]|jgi:putative ubiquitin-RnfH superfamily antitoxin RatB of RatAB toxin-antitoxin module|uniref:RnfH family protein n=1 Tax=unclassified Trinickia TaxID=2638168 RepID=UPI002404BE42|nr:MULTISPECIES: RnfH family protein [unclassified Trinickia]MDG0024123.1 RnfH family protein [Trinickia sp. Y13]HVW49171.1 RnfH family protein [Trinickia sp.]
MSATLSIEVCYARPEAQTLIALTLPAGATVRDALAASGMTTRHPEIDPATAKVGVFGKLATLDTPLADHDRVEIYRPLIVDPKLARQRRVEKTRRAGSIEGRKWLHKDSR